MFMINADKYKGRLEQLKNICLESYKEDRNFLKIEKYIIKLLKEAIENKNDKLESLARIDRAKSLMEGIEFEYNDTYVEEALMGTLLSGVHIDKKVISEVCSQLSVVNCNSDLIKVINKLNESDKDINLENVLNELYFKRDKTMNFEGLVDRQFSRKERKGAKNAKNAFIKSIYSINLMDEEKRKEKEYDIKYWYLKKTESPDNIESFSRIVIQKYVQKYLIEILWEIRNDFLNQIIRRLNLLFNNYIKVKSDEKYKKEIEEITTKLKEIGYHFTGVRGGERELIKYMTDKGKELYCKIEMSMALKGLTSEYDIEKQANKFIKSIWKLESEIAEKHIIQPGRCLFYCK